MVGRTEADPPEPLAQSPVEQINASLRGWIGEEPSLRRGLIICGDQRLLFAQGGKRSTILWAHRYSEIDRIFSNHAYGAGSITITVAGKEKRFLTLESEEDLNCFADSVIQKLRSFEG